MTDNTGDLLRFKALASQRATAHLEENILDHLSHVCESPIEVMLGAALLWTNQLDRLGYWPPALVCVPQAEIGDYHPETRLLVPQYRWRNFRIDFAYIDLETPLTVFIECDGHDFHERTKQQAARDRLKDRVIQQAGLPILRFTGAEITRDPMQCADSIFHFVSELHTPIEART
jgi:very-short-patch-repair endonuclease